MDSLQAKSLHMYMHVICDFYIKIHNFVMLHHNKWLLLTIQ